MSFQSGNDPFLIDLLKDLSKEVKELNSKIGKLDVLEQRILTLSSTVDRLSDYFGHLPDLYLAKSDYQRKGITDKMMAIQKDLADFKVSVEKGFREVTEKADENDKKGIMNLSAVQLGIVTIILSLLSSGLFFALQLVFHH